MVNITQEELELLCQILDEYSTRIKFLEKKNEILETKLDNAIILLEENGILF